MRDNSWRVWEWRNEVESTLLRRATGEFPEMESTKQLVKLLSEVYVPSMKVLDVGCGPGHYLQGLRRLDSQISYHGVDATKRFIEAAHQIYQDDPNVNFEICDIFDLAFPEQSFDIVICCNLILHLPDFQAPIRNLLSVCKKYCYIRTLISDRSYIVKYVQNEDFDEHGNPLQFIYQNTYSKNVLRRFIESQGNFGVEFIENEFDSRVINQEFKNLKKGHGTRCVSGMQIEGNIVFDWRIIKITRLSE